MKQRNDIAALDANRLLLAGFGAANQAVAKALRQSVPEVLEILAFDDALASENLAAAEHLSVELVEAPDEKVLKQLLAACDAVVPTPGMSDFHRLFELLDTQKVLSEYDIFADLDDRPFVAVTGTNGKTTVTELVCRMLRRSEVKAVAAGNTDLALTAAASDREAELFVVEASSFQLRHTRNFRPMSAAWLNFTPDHLDVHRSLQSYEDSKALVWGCSRGRQQIASGSSIANVDDPVVTKRAPDGAVFFSCTDAHSKEADFCVSNGWLLAEGEKFAEVAELPRSRPHDLSNALAATALALAAGGKLTAAAEVLRDFSGLPHRLQLVAESGGVEWYNDSKATTPHATAAAISGFESVVLIAGGRNKGLELAPMAAAASSAETDSPVRAVVAIGETAPEIGLLFAGYCPVTTASSMAEAVAAAAELSKPGDAVLLSPACTAHDWYSDYKQRGDDFTREAQAAAEGAGA